MDVVKAVGDIFAGNILKLRLKGRKNHIWYRKRLVSAPMTGT
jgi:hypothetical protein